MDQVFKDVREQDFEELSLFPGSSLSILAEPVPEGSIHRLKMKKRNTYSRTYTSIRRIRICSIR